MHYCRRFTATNMQMTVNISDLCSHISTPMKHFLNLLLAFLVILFVLLIGLIPFVVLYLFSDLMYLLLFGVFRYRRKIIYKNLEGCFPDIEKKEFHRLIRLTYRNLTDVIVEGIKGFSMTHRQIRNRHKILNPEIIESYYESGRSVIALPCHYGNWEWGSLSPGLQIKFNIVGFYKPLSNPYVDRFLRWSRSRTGTTLVSIYETTKTFELNQGTKTAFLMVADQSPSNPDKAYWVNFLGRDTAFLYGPEKHARNNNLPVVYVDVQRVKRGYYTIFLSVITDNPSELEKGEITQRYANKLESVILKQPENWLWSHRRWKLRR